MQEVIINIMNECGYLGILLLIAVENIFPPIPSELILTFGGFITTYSNINIIGVIIAATIGSEIGAIILYILGKMLSQERLEKVVKSKIGKILRLKKKDIEKAYTGFQKRGKLAVLFCRFIPIVRSLISIPAGMTKMNIPYFLTLTLIGSLIWNTVLIILGRCAGEYWGDIVKSIDKYSNLIWIIIPIIIVGMIIYKRKKRNMKKGEINIRFIVK